ncbi:Ig-like domain-containing protein, partial [Halomonas sp. LBP4]|uniref:Ig-like domain-containing protein n=1 Tax=Halomonas sp. LBP4 TaxID=2044917 RepID=UPI0015E8EA07
MASRYTYWGRIRALLAAFAGAGAIASGTAQAELIEYSFTSPVGEKRSLLAASRYANPVDKIDFALSGGVDRKVKVSIVKMDGSVLDSATSHLLGADDLITAAGNQFYGAILTLSAPADGSYTISSQILSSADEVVSEKQHALVVDTQAPGVTGSITSTGDGGYSQIGSGGTPNHFGSTFTNYIQLSGLDDNVGVKEATINTYSRNGSTVGDLQATDILPFDADTSSVYAGSGRGTLNIYFPDPRASYRVEFIVEDVAGNKAKKYRDITFNNSCGPLPEPVAASRPGSSNKYLGASVFQGFEPWSDGSTIYENPVTLVWRLPKTNWADATPHGIFLSPDYQDANYVYKKIERPLTDWVNSNDGNFRSRTRWGCKAYSDFTGQLAPGVNATPKMVKREIKMRNGGWLGNVMRTNKKDTVDAIRFTVEPRSYKQTVTIGTSVGTKTCYIGAGNTTCSVGIGWTPSGKGYSPWTIRVRDQAGKFNVFSNYALMYWDFNKPSIQTLDYSEESRQGEISVYDADTTSNWTNYFWQPAEASLSLMADGMLAHEVGSEKIVYDTNNYGFKFSLDSAPHGLYEMRAVVIDTYGNISTKNFGQVTIDQVSPDLGIDSTEGYVITTLDSLRIFLSDDIDNSPEITSAKLSGGPSKDVVSLSSRWVDDGYYMLEYPIIFPSLQSGEEYTLSVVAEDAQRNQATRDFTFTYEPPRVSLQGGVDGKLMIPAVVHEFKHLDGRRIIETQPLTLADGSTVAGTYDVFASLRSDAEVPLIVNGVRIEPGQTSRIMSRHDFAASDGRLSLPLLAA